VFATLEVLAMRFQRGIVTGHCWIDPCNGRVSGAYPEAG
jgi:hypothetical protein